MFSDPFSLDNKTILVTGASSGIGRTTAVECAKKGATVIITGTNLERLQNTFDELCGEREHQLFQCNLAEEEQIKELTSSLPPLDGCILAAGIGHTLPIQFIDKKHIEEVYSINLFAPILLTKYLLKNKKLQKKASIVFVSSLGGVEVFNPGNTVYGTSKSALDSYMKFAAIELTAKNIRCNSVCPGMINTPLIQRESFTEESKAKDMEHYPMKRYGEPEEVAYPIIFLLSDAASYITGQSLIIDGGRTLR